jgi:hypothetical protein
MAVVVLGFSVAQMMLMPARAQSQPAKQSQPEKMKESRPVEFKDLCGRQLNEPIAAFFDRLTKVEGASITLRDSQFIGVLDKGNINWSFTVAGHPAHPSVACRKLVEVDGRYRVLTNISCQADERACEQLVADYKQLDKRMMEAMEKEQQKK